MTQPSQALCAIALLSAVVASGCRPPSEPVETRIVFVGIDGASWKVIGPGIERGELPTFARLAEEGAVARRFETFDPTLSPIIWTTIATGRMPEQHGVRGFTQRLVTGERIPVTNASRREKAIWEVASEHGVSTGVLGWWATWPAQPLEGWVVTDHANPIYMSFLEQDGRYLEADRGWLRDFQRDFHPVDLAPVLSRHWLTEEAFPHEEVVERLGLTPAQGAALREAAWHERSLYSVVKTFYGHDRSLFRVGRDLGRERPVRLQLYYFRLVDLVQHYGWDLVEPEAYEQPPVHLARDRGVVEGAYRLMDSYLAEILEDLPDDTWLVVASDHGAEPAHEALPNPTPGKPGEHSAAAKGVLFLHGPGVRAQASLESATPLDLMPTLAWLLGLPVADDLPGRVLDEAFQPSFAETVPRRRVATYGRREERRPEPSPEDEQMLESLRAVGYIR